MQKDKNQLKSPALARNNNNNNHNNIRMEYKAKTRKRGASEFRKQKSRIPGNECKNCLTSSQLPHLCTYYTNLKCKRGEKDGSAQGLTSQWISRMERGAKALHNKCNKWKGKTNSK